jgi:non-homologous end joining protein Ku
VRPYYIVPDGKVGHDAYAVIRETIRLLDQVAIARVVLTNRELACHRLASTRHDPMGIHVLKAASAYWNNVQEI